MSYWVIDANLAVNTALNLSPSLERFWERINQDQITPLRAAPVDERDDFRSPRLSRSKANQP